MSWLALFGQSGCLTDEQQEQAAAAARDYTVALQKDLADAGYFDGEVDGVYGPETVDAVEALQQANGLPQTGTVDKATDAALRSELEAAGGAADQESHDLHRCAPADPEACRLLGRSGRRAVVR